MATSRVRDCVNAAVDGLKVHAGLLAVLGSAKVNTHVPQGTTPPYTMVMGGTEVPWAETLEEDEDGGDSGGRQVDVLTQCVSTYQGSKEVDSIAAEVMECLIGPASSVWDAVDGFQIATFISNVAQPPIDLNADGVLWFVRLVTVRVTLE